MSQGEGEYRPPEGEWIDEVVSKVRAGDETAGTKITRLDDTYRRDLEQDIRLKKVYAWILLILLTLQMATVDVGIYFYGVNNAWDIDPTVLHWWLGSTVVEIVGIVLVVTRYLFPRRDRPSG